MKNRIFSGRKLTDGEKKRMEKFGSSELGKRLEAAEEIRKERERSGKEKRRERRKKRQKIKQKKSKILDAVTSYKSKAIGKKSALDIIYAALDPDERDTLRSYDSDSMIAIAEEYALSPYDTLDEAIAAFEAQQQEAFGEMEDDEYETNWEGVPWI